MKKTLLILLFAATATCTAMLDLNEQEYEKAHEGLTQELIDLELSPEEAAEIAMASLYMHCSGLERNNSLYGPRKDNFYVQDLKCIHLLEKFRSIKNNSSLSIPVEVNETNNK